MKAKVEAAVKREPVAVIYCTHFVMKGENGEAVYLTGNESKCPPPDTVMVHSIETFQDVLDWCLDGEVVYKGDKVTLQF